MNNDLHPLVGLQYLRANVHVSQAETSHPAISIPEKTADYYVANASGSPVEKSPQQSKRQPTTVAVRYFKSDGASERIVRNIERLVTNYIGTQKEFKVIGYDEIQELLDHEQKKQLAGCESDVNCLAEIAGAMGAEKLVFGTVGFLEGSYVISLQLLDSRTAEVESRAQIRGVSKVDSQKLAEAADAVAQQLIGPLLWKEKPKPWRTYQIFKWSGVALALGSLGLGVGMAVRSQSKEKEYNSLFKTLVNNGTIVQPPVENCTERHCFKDEADPRYKRELDGLKKNSKRDALIANVGFGVAGTLLTTAGLFFYLDYKDQKRTDEMRSNSNTGPVKTGWNISFTKDSAFATFKLSY